MATPLYAAHADLTAAPWSLDIEEEASALLITMASRLVRQATKLAIYATDPETSLPTDTALREAMREATCSQIATWVGLSIDPIVGSAGSNSVVGSKSFGGKTITYADAAQTVAARAAATQRLTMDAMLTLMQAGLTGSGPVVLG